MIEIPFSDFTERYAYVDPASGKKASEMKKVRARSAIVVIAPDWMGRVFVLEAWAARCSTDDLIEKMYSVHDAFKLKVMGGEANGLQSLFQDAVIRDARLRGKQLPLQPIMQPTKIDKDWRIRNRLGPVLSSGRLFVRDDMTELKTEIAGFPLTPFKDLIDALASAIALMPVRATRPEKDRETEKLLSYLRQSGAPASHIEKVHRERMARTPWFSTSTRS